MKILLPAHNKVANKVRSWKEIKSEALEMQRFIAEGKFAGYYDKAYAISHAQVSDQPKSFFVLNKDKDYGLLKVFKSGVVVNLRILKQYDPVEFKEACMSWPFRQPTKTERFYDVIVKYEISFLGFLIPVTKRLKGLPAFICQHETDHAEGRNIYNK